LGYSGSLDQDQIH